MNEEFEFTDEENRFGKDENDAPDEKKEIVFVLPHTVELLEPIVLTETNTVTELVFKKKINLGMLAHMPTGDVTRQKVGHLMPIVKGMTGQTDLVVKRLSWDDAQECFEVVNYFLTRSVKKKSIGGTTSD